MEKPSFARRLLGFLRSMKFAVLLLLALAAVCTVGSLLPQNELAAYYTGNYPAWAANWILALGLDHLFTAWWFVLLTAALCLNLVFCSVSRFPQLLRRFRTGFSLQQRLGAQDASFAFVTAASQAELEKQWGIRLAAQPAPAGEPGENWAYGVKNRVGLWGSWLCHLGMLVIIAGFAAGQIFSLKTAVYGVPGDTLPVEGTAYTVTIDSFSIALRPDDTVEQYTAGLTVTDTATGETQTGVSQVNAPLSAFGLRLYQNSTGWASTVSVYQNDVLMDSRVLCAGEYIAPDDLPELVLAFYRFYPDYYNDGSGPATRSGNLNNPAAIFALYYQQELIAMDVVGMEQPIAVDDYTFVFSSPQPYTLIQIVRDPAMPIAAVGGAMVLLALVLAFYAKPEELWTCTRAGERQVWVRSGKARELYQDRIDRLTGGAAPPPDDRQ